MKTIIITEKTSQKKDLAAAIGNKYGEILAAEGHLLSLQEPQKVNGKWGKWSFDLLKPDDFYPTCPAPDASPSARNKLMAIEAGLKTADKVILATDCDREGQLIGEELLRHYRFKGPVERAIFTAQDEKTLRQAFEKLEPNDKYQNLGQAAVARQQADQVYNLSLTRAATVALKEPGQYGAIGIGRVKTPTLAIVCIRELEIQKFSESDYYHIVATAQTEAGTLMLKHAPKDKITDKARADELRGHADGFNGPLKATKTVKTKKPPKLLDLPELQKICSRKWGWNADKTLEIAQELYDGDGKKIQTYPRAESRYLSENQIEDIGEIVRGLQRLPQYQELDLSQPQVRKGKAGHFSDEALKGVSHHAIVPNKNTMDRISQIYPRLSEDERKMFDLVASSYLAILMPDYTYESTSISMDVLIPEDKTIEFKITGNIPLNQGWKSVYTDVMEKKEEDAGELPPVKDGDMATLSPVEVDLKKTKPPKRFSEGTLIDAMQNAWKFVEDKDLQSRLKEAKGIGTPATRASIISGLKLQKFLMQKGKNIVPSEAGLTLFKTLKAAAPELVDPGVTALWEMKLDDVLLGERSARDVWDEIGNATARLISVIRQNAAQAPKIVTGIKAPKGLKGGKPTPKMLEVTKKIATEKGLSLPKGYTSDFQVCKEFLDEHLGGKVDPLKAAERQLTSGMFGDITEKMAQEIIASFGAESVRIVEETPERLADVKGITAAKVKAITEHLEAKKACKVIGNVLGECRIPPIYALRLYKVYGDKTLETLQKSPYQIIRDVKTFGFENADKLAQKAGLSPESVVRAGAALYHALNQSRSPRPKDGLFAMLEKRLSLTTQVLAQALEVELEAKEITTSQGDLSLAVWHKQDQDIAKRLKALNQGAVPWPEFDGARALTWAIQKFKLQLPPPVQEVARRLLTCKVSALDVAAGAQVGPVLKAVAEILLAKGQKVTVVAPTRGQAKELAALSDLDAKSVVKALGWTAKTQKYKHTARKRLDCTLMIVQDAHVMDRAMLGPLLDALDPEAACLFVGDFQKSPALTSAQMLEGMKAHPISLPVLSAPESQRVQALTALRHNKPLEVRADASDFFKLDVANPDDGVRKLSEIVQNRLPKRFKFNAIKDIQVVCAGQGGPLGTMALNRHLQHLLNGEQASSQIERFGGRYRVGDKVIACENNLDQDVLAGEIGVVKAIDKTAQIISMTFSGKTVALAFDELDHFALAYAVLSSQLQHMNTKAVVACLPENGGLYDAFSAASELAVWLKL
ncbi:DNA topoisomerase [Terasakiella pusilla]|uniref:DNA topoisomerase n=1 Tax=Terasakiella pusilla TaxID=64973 RepID=UPI003AA91849